jgi:hypothetical protein
MAKHSINRSGATENSQDEHTEGDVDDSDDTTDEQRSEAEIKRELRGSVVGQAILRRNRELKDRRRRK